ncbi:polysaccharide deacetylase family protein [Novosphingobium sp.]|uniref:polysaccharide deacetylase family protein n=1 Tax=Novosphingobium sp. TaxID=1874826 RepID=UPI003B523D6D
MPRRSSFTSFAQILPALFLAGGAAMAAPVPQDVAPAASAAAPAPRPEAANVALTFDDLPGIVLKPDQNYLDATNRSLVNSLVSHHFPAIGFVNEGKLNEIIRRRQIAVLHLWLNAGFDLGNHTYSHSSPNKVGVNGYIADIARGERLIRPMMEAAHRNLQWFRHPYLETGSPKRVKAKIDSWLTAHGYKIAPVTIDCDDWEFAEPYDNAVMSGDTAEAERIRGVYLAYTEQTIAWDRRAAQLEFGRPIAFVMLLHDTRLNADSFDGLVAILDRQNLHPVSLAQAMADPAYRTPDIYHGRDGIEWLERWSKVLRKNLPWDDFEDVPKDIVKEYNKLEDE